MARAECRDDVKLVELAVARRRVALLATQGTVPVSFTPGRRLPGQVFPRDLNLNEIQLVKVKILIRVTGLKNSRLVPTDSERDHIVENLQTEVG